MIFKKTLFICITFALCCFFPAQVAKADCILTPEDLKIESLIASASFWSNFYVRTGSLRFESNRMLEDSEKNLPNIKAPESLCKANCKAEYPPSIVFTSIPSKFRTDNEDFQDCEALFKETEKAPLAFHDHSFSDIESFATWLSEFSRGYGEDGAALYEKCTGTCSPRYTSVVTKISNGYKADIFVVCGPARDKSDNTYQLTSSYRWKCIPQ